MSEENKDEVVIPSKDELLSAGDEDLGTGESGDNPVGTEFSDMEQQAIDMGWNPDKEAVGDKWVNAEIFLARAPLFDEVHSLKRALKNRNKDIDAMKHHLEMMRKKTLNDSVNDLKAKKKEAMEMGDYDSVETYEEEIDKLKEEEREVVQETQSTGPSEEYVEWASDNSWYQSDSELTQFADLIAPGIFGAAKQGDDVTELYNEVTKQVKARFPDKFGSRKPAPQSVESPRGTTRSTTKATTKKYSLSDVPAEEREIAKNIIRQIGEEAYLKDYFGE